MMQQPRRPSGWWYVVAGLIPVLGCVLAAWLGYFGANSALSSSTTTVRVTMPGTELIELEQGQQTIFYTYTSAVDERRAAALLADGFECGVSAAGTAQEASLARLAGNTYFYANNERYEGLWSINIPETGTYQIECSGGAQFAPVALMIGDVPLGNILSSVFGILAICLITPIIGGVIALIVFLRRRRNRPAPPPTYMPPPGYQ